MTCIGVVSDMDTCRTPNIPSIRSVGAVEIKISNLNSWKHFEFDTKLTFDDILITEHIFQTQAAPKFFFMC
jgi:hypothetical protein